MLSRSKDEDVPFGMSNSGATKTAWELSLSRRVSSIFPPRSDKIEETRLRCNLKMSSASISMKQNPEEMFLEIYEAHADAIFRHCYFRVSDRDRAKELTQESFMK